jgi:hypothetical protein
VLPLCGPRVVIARQDTIVIMLTKPLAVSNRHREPFGPRIPVWKSYSVLLLLPSWLSICKSQPCMSLQCESPSFLESCFVMPPFTLLSAAIALVRRLCLADSVIDHDSSWLHVRHCKPQWLRVTLPLTLDDTLCQQLSVGDFHNLTAAFGEPSAYHMPPCWHNSAPYHKCPHAAAMWVCCRWQPLAQRTALVTLYHATGGPGWHRRAGWLTGDPCSGAWDCVHCRNDGTAVVYVALRRWSNSWYTLSQ